MNPSSNISNENALLVDILQRMYADNIHQINSLTSSLNNIRNTNNQIRNLLVQILLYPNSNTRNLNANINTNNRSSNRIQRESNQRNNTLGRVILDNVPYVIDSIEHYTTPLTSATSATSATRNTNLRRLSEQFWQPIEVFPTQSQIELATRNVRYCDILNPVNRSCPISLDTFTDSDMVSVIRFCGHIFKIEQLNTWFMANCRCPVCRYDIRSYQSNTPTNIFSQNNTDQVLPSSVDVSNNSTTENTSVETNEERNPSTNIPVNSRQNTFTNYLDIFLDNTLSEFSDANDISPLISLLSSLQRRQR
jgi:hypothetical protein